MILDIERYTEILTELGISANQYLLCYLLYYDQKVDDKYINKKRSKKYNVPIANLYKYASQAVGWTSEEVEDLINKGYLEDETNHVRKEKDIYPDYLTVTEKFKKKAFIYKEDFNELYDAYPTTMENFNNPNGPRIKLKVCDKFKMRERYEQSVKTKKKHKKIMGLLEWAKENGEINFNFKNFITGELWNTIEESKKEGVINDNMEGTAAK